MPSNAIGWADFDAGEPALAALVRRCFAVRKHATMATLRRDGSPRISGTEVQFTDDGLFVGSMPGALKALDLRRDPRVALHCPTVDTPSDDPASWLGDAKIAGLAREILNLSIDADADADAAARQPSHRFAVDVTEVVHVGLAHEGDHLTITSWSRAHGLRRRDRW